MTSRSSHQPKSADVVDFDSLVWPPPELRPPPTPVPLIVHGANNQQYKVYPGQSFSEARRLAGIKRSGTPSSSTVSDNQPLQSTSWIAPHAPPAPLKDNRPPLRPKSSQVPASSKLANGPAGSKDKGRFGCKDYPTGYVPTPRPLSPPVNPYPNVVPVAPTPSRVTPPPPSATALTFYERQHSVATTESESPIIACPSHQYPTQQHRSQSQTITTPMGFFEPYSVVIRPDNNGQDDFISPVVENGRVVSYCRIPGRSGLSPGGVIERGWSEDSYSSTPISNDISRSLLLGTDPSSSGTSPLVILPDHLKGQPPHSSPSASSSSSYVPSYYTNSYPTPHSKRHSQYDQQEAAGPAFATTRKGYWNRRGDTLTADGRVIPALGSSAYPPDLAHYPQYALVNETGRVVLPEVEQDRVAVWRNVGY